MADTCISEFIEYLNADKTTKTIMVYLESLKDGKKFMESCKKTRKPIFILKAGKTEAGAGAAKSHTGAMAGSYKIYSGAFKQCGARECSSLDQLLNASITTEKIGLLKGKKIVVVTNAGGPGVLMTDALSEKGFEITKPPKKVLEKLDRILPKSWSKGNPVDVLGDADAERFEKTLKALTDKKFYDAVIVVFTPQSMSEPEKTAKTLIKMKEKLSPLITCFIGGLKTGKAEELLRQGGVPVFKSIDRVPDSVFTES